MTKKVLMIVGDFAETLEVYCPMFMMQCMGIEVEVVCPNKNKGECVTTAVHDFTPEFQTYTEKTGHTITLTCNWNSINPKNYDGLCLPGGRAPEYLRLNPTVMECVKCFITCGKPIAAMCHGPQLLTATGMMNTRKMTAYPTCMPEITMCNAEYVKVPNDECCVDGNIVTAPTWMACPKMVNNFVNLLGVKPPCCH
jgi:protease I